jgi:hypothetical protein
MKNLRCTPYYILLSTFALNNRYIMLGLSSEQMNKFSPFHNRDIVWFYLFLPAVAIYFHRLHSYVNSKPSIGYLQTLDPSFSKYIYQQHGMEIIARNMSWSEGPLWIDNDALGYLVYSDTIQNRIYRWEEGKGFFTVGKTLFMRNTGCYSNLSYCEDLSEPGSNGLVRIPADPYDPSVLDLIACQHGERSIGVLKSNGTRYVS